MCCCLSVPNLVRKKKRGQKNVHIFQPKKTPEEKNMKLLLFWEEEWFCKNCSFMELTISIQNPVRKCKGLQVMPSCEVLVQGWPLALQLWSPRKSWTNGKSKLHPRKIALQWKNKHAKMYFLSKIFKCSIAMLVSWRVPFWIPSDLPATRHPLIRLFFFATISR